MGVVLTKFEKNTSVFFPSNLVSPHDVKSEEQPTDISPFLQSFKQ